MKEIIVSDSYLSARFWRRRCQPPPYWWLRLPCRWSWIRIPRAVVARSALTKPIWEILLQRGSTSTRLFLRRYQFYDSSLTDWRCECRHRGLEGEQRGIQERVVGAARGMIDVWNARVKPWGCSPRHCDERGCAPRCSLVLHGWKRR